MDPKELFQTPFTDAHDEGVIGMLGDDARKAVDVIEEINANADVA